MSDWTKGDGALIKIIFDKNLYPIEAENTLASNFTVTCTEMTYVPGGTGQSVSKAVKTVSQGDNNKEIVLEMMPLQRFENAVGMVTVAYDGLGGLAGDSGVVSPFSIPFLPTELVPKPNQNDISHFGITNIIPTVYLRKIIYSDVQSAPEHFNIAEMTATATLTYVEPI